MESQALFTYLFLWIRVVLYVAYWIKLGHFLNTVIFLLFNAYGEIDGQVKRRSAVSCVAVYQNQVCRNSFSFEEKTVELMVEVAFDSGLYFSLKFQLLLHSF